MPIGKCSTLTLSLMDCPWKARAVIATVWRHEANTWVTMTEIGHHSWHAIRYRQVLRRNLRNRAPPRENDCIDMPNTNPNNPLMRDSRRTIQRIMI